MRYIKTFCNLFSFLSSKEFLQTKHTNLLLMLHLHRAQTPTYSRLLMCIYLLLFRISMTLFIFIACKFYFSFFNKVKLSIKISLIIYNFSRSQYYLFHSFIRQNIYNKVNICKNIYMIITYLTVSYSSTSGLKFLLNIRYSINTLP